MTEVTFQTGDVVQLKVGGEPMTIEGIDDDGIDCVWFEGSELRRARALPISLKQIVDEDELAAIAVTRQAARDAADAADAK